MNEFEPALPEPITEHELRPNEAALPEARLEPGGIEVGDQGELTWRRSQTKPDKRNWDGYL